jgi:telomerase Cajal body protein 1
VFSFGVPGDAHTSVSTSKLPLFPFRGIVSALAVSQDNILAIGTYSNTIALFSSTYEPVSAFKVPLGTGVTELKWDPSGRYLYIVPRNSSEVQIWDVRQIGQMVCSLGDRQAHTNQRLWTDLSSDGHYFLSGGTDGFIRAWNTQSIQGEILPQVKLKAHDGMFFGGGW